MDVKLRRYFRHPHTLAMFGRYATYVGASPHRAPSIFNMMAHVETGLGVFGVKGGTYSIVEAFVQLAQELGVEISLSTEASRIRVRNGRAVGVETADGDIAEADTVVVNADALAAVQRLLPEHERPSSPGRKLEQLEPSVGGFVLLAGVERDYPDLLHHNVFFPQRYSREFVDLFDHRVLPEEPAIYVCRSGGAEGRGAREASAVPLILRLPAPACSSWSTHPLVGPDILSRNQRSLYRACSPEAGGGWVDGS